jgi:hypothetical protein
MSQATWTIAVARQAAESNRVVCRQHRVSSSRRTCVGIVEPVLATALDIAMRGPRSCVFTNQMHDIENHTLCWSFLALCQKPRLDPDVFGLIHADTGTAITAITVVVFLGNLVGILLLIYKNNKEEQTRSADRIDTISDTSVALRNAYASPEESGSRAQSTVGAPRNPAEFVAFWESTYKRLENYHGDAGRQLRSSYHLAQVSAICGFTVVIVLGLVAAKSSDSTQTISAAAVATVGAALAAYISQTFNSTYARSLAQSASFFHEPVVLARLLAAERLLDRFGSSDDERAMALTMMIKAAVSFDLAEAPKPAEGATDKRPTDRGV